MALSEAEDRDAVKIIHTWKNECSVHEMLYKMHLAKQVTKVSNDDGMYDQAHSINL